MDRRFQDRDALTRRSFLAAMPAVAAVSLPVANGEGKLAADGGMPVRATRLTTEYPGTQLYDEQERGELTEAYDSHSLFRFYGPTKPRKVAAFEKELAGTMGAKYALAVTSGTAALHCSLAAIGVGPGEEVILPAWTWHSCYMAILLTGALPVFAEVDESFSMDPKDLEAKITPQTKAVMPVHLFGAPADMGRIMPIARKHGLRVIEDAAQSVGADYEGKRLGTIGDIGVYSFQIHKVITAGEGGAIVTDDPLLYERAIRFHDLGLLRPLHREILSEPRMPFSLGVNYRMNEMTGAVLRGQLRKLNTILAQYRQKSRFVKDSIKDLHGIKLRQSNDPKGEIGWTVDLLLPDKKMRDRFVAAMNAENVAASPPSAATPLPPMPYIEQKCAPHPAWPSFNSPRGKAMIYGAQCCPQTLDIYNRAATLTIGPKFTLADLKDMVAAITKVYGALLGQS